MQSEVSVLITSISLFELFKGLAINNTTALCVIVSYLFQGSRWTFQATRMDGELGSWSLKPDQVQVVNPLLILLFIPVFEAVIYPLLAKCNIKRPLQKLGIGGVLGAVAFVISAIVELQLQVCLF